MDQLNLLIKKHTITTQGKRWQVHHKITIPSNITKEVEVIVNQWHRLCILLNLLAMCHMEINFTRNQCKN